MTLYFLSTPCQQIILNVPRWVQTLHFFQNGQIVLLSGSSYTASLLLLLQKSFDNWKLHNLDLFLFFSKNETVPHLMSLSLCNSTACLIERRMKGKYNNSWLIHPALTCCTLSGEIKALSMPGRRWQPKSLCLPSHFLHDSHPAGAYCSFATGSSLANDINLEILTLFLRLSKPVIHPPHLFNSPFMCVCV